MASSSARSGGGLSLVDQRALRAVAVQFFLNGAVVATFIPRLPEIRDRVGVTLGELGVLFTIAALCGLGSSMVAGRLIERVGTRQVITMCSVVYVGSLFVIGAASNAAVLLVGLICFAAFDVLIDIAMNLQGSWLSERRDTPVMNRLHGLWSLGTVLSGVAAAQLAGAGVPLGLHLNVAAGVFGIGILFVRLGLLRTDEPTADQSDAAVVGEADVDAGETSKSTSIWRPLLLLAIAGGCSLTMEMTSSDWAAFRLTDDFGRSAGFAGLGYVAFTAGMTTARFGGDWLQERWGPDRLFNTAVLVSAIGLTGAGLAPNAWVSLMSYVVAGVGIATFFPRLYDDAAKAPGRPGAGLGALTAGSAVSAIVAPAAVGALATSSLSVGVATAIVTLPSVAVLAALAFRGTSAGSSVGTSIRPSAGSSN